MAHGVEKQLEEDNGTDSDANREKYMFMLGGLLYLSNGTRVDIAYAVNYLARYSQNPKEKHWDALRHVMEYIITNDEYALVYKKRDWNEEEVGNMVQCYADANFGNRLDGRSTTGFVTYVCGDVVTWRSTKQGCVATSTMEAEYNYKRVSRTIIILLYYNYIMQDGLYVIQVLNEINAATEGSMTIYNDNQGAIAFAVQGRRGRDTWALNTTS